MRHSQTRRHFLRACMAAIAAVLLSDSTLRATPLGGVPRGPHPSPRPGITGARVLTPKQLADKPQLVPLFNSVREIPEVLDGIRCNCGCAHSDGFYSLLSCYEGLDAMAKECVVCQGQGRLAVRLHKSGRTLDEIRTAVDARFG